LVKCPESDGTTAGDRVLNALYRHCESPNSHEYPEYHNDMDKACITWTYSTPWEGESHVLVEKLEGSERVERHSWYSGQSKDMLTCYKCPEGKDAKYDHIMRDDATGDVKKDLVM